MGILKEVGIARRASKLTIAAAASLVLALPGLCDDRYDARQRAPVVRTARASEVGVQQRAFTGIVRARVESNVGFRIGGKVIERLVEVGATVRKGDILMRIDGTDLGLALKAKVNAVISFKAGLARSEAAEHRIGRLLSAGAASQQVYDKARQDFETDAAELDAALAEADVARNELSYAVLVAESDGVIMDTLAEPGQVIAAGQTVITLAHDGEREVSIILPETIRPLIGSAGQAVLYRAGTAPMAARLRQLSSTADPATRTFEARYVLRSVQNMPLGSTVTVTIDLPAATPTVAAVDVPIGALSDRGSGMGVWIVRQGHVTFAPVTIQQLGREFATVSGIDKGATVVSVGANILTDGMAVRLDTEEVISQ
ncbi:efflux RND transporter periplasmic adaptor subunit [Rhizobium leguminosarum]|uniref:efflux RND transporter periplasmic adaptor subunit n=1 Tax=Rhizobium TaxID=379 RepID=UPI0013EE8DC7|nr:efflux RND transporter periplasmic adaptor subunit [Rhizobium leguminosarum]